MKDSTCATAWRTVGQSISTVRLWCNAAGMFTFNTGLMKLINCVLFEAPSPSVLRKLVQTKQVTVNSFPVWLFCCLSLCHLLKISSIYTCSSPYWLCNSFFISSYITKYEIRCSGCLLYYSHCDRGVPRCYEPTYATRISFQVQPLIQKFYLHWQINPSSLLVIFPSIII